MLRTALIKSARSLTVISAGKASTGSAAAAVSASGKGGTAEVSMS